MSDFSKAEQEEVQRHLGLVQGSISGTGLAHQLAKQRLLYSLSTTPLFSRKVKQHVETNIASKATSPFKMYGLLGLRTNTYGGSELDELSSDTENSSSYVDDLVYSNTSAPWSAFICGQQGAGKSYTFSCLMGNALLRGDEVGQNDKPLTGLIFHYDKHSASYSTQVCEAAYLSSKGVKVEVLVSPTNVTAMQQAYNLPGIPKDKQPAVKPLLFNESLLKLDYMLSLMNQGAADGMPLYMAKVVSIVREMKIKQEPFSIRVFETKCRTAGFKPDQTQMLELRLALLKTFMWSTATGYHQGLAGKCGIKSIGGHLTIVDLSCSTINESDVCKLYEICLSMSLASRNSPPSNPQPQTVLESQGPAGSSTQSQTPVDTAPSLIIGIDEAHKFLTDTPEALSFTSELIRLIRQQRHLKSRVIIATQEPTLSPQLMDLCDVSIVHRFRSPAWFAAIREHLAGLVFTGDVKGSQSGKEVFGRIVGLRDGEALVFASSAVLDVGDAIREKTDEEIGDVQVTEEEPESDSSGTSKEPSTEQEDDFKHASSISSDDSDADQVSCDKSASSSGVALDKITNGFSDVKLNGDKSIQEKKSKGKEVASLSTSSSTSLSTDRSVSQLILEPLRTAYIKIQIRQRLTMDGGKSQMAQAVHPSGMISGRSR